MTQVAVSERVEASADAVWDLLRDFGGVARYMRGLEACTSSGEGVGAVRTVRLPGGATLQERLESLDEAGRSLSYAIIGSCPIPVTDYLSTVRVTPQGRACTIDWSGCFEPAGVPEEQARGMIEGVYRSGITGIRKALGA